MFGQMQVFSGSFFLWFCLMFLVVGRGFLSLLLCLESMVLMSLFLVVSYVSVHVVFLLLVIAVGEGVVGLALLVSLSREKSGMSIS